MSYRTPTSFGHGYENPTEITEVLCRVIPGVNAPGTVRTYPTEHNPGLLGVSNKRKMPLSSSLSKVFGPYRTETPFVSLSKTPKAHAVVLLFL